MVITPDIEEALALLYTGQVNVAVKAEELDLPLELLKAILDKYITRNPISPDGWDADIELSWPYAA